MVTPTICYLCKNGWIPALCQIVTTVIFAWNKTNNGDACSHRYLFNLKFDQFAILVINMNKLGRNLKWLKVSGEYNFVKSYIS